MAGTESRRVSWYFGPCGIFRLATSHQLNSDRDYFGIVSLEKLTRQSTRVLETLPHDTSLKRARPVAEDGNVIKVIGGFVYRRGEG